MKYHIAAAVLAVGLFATTGTASAQHGGRHGGTYGHGYAHGGHGPTPGGHVAPRVGVYPYSAPSYGGYSQGYGVGVYSGPAYSGPVHGRGRAGHG